MDLVMRQRIVSDHCFCPSSETPGWPRSPSRGFRHRRFAGVANLCVLQKSVCGLVCGMVETSASLHFRTGRMVTSWTWSLRRSCKIRSQTATCFCGCRDSSSRFPAFLLNCTRMTASVMNSNPSIHPCARSSSPSLSLSAESGSLHRLPRQGR